MVKDGRNQRSRESAAEGASREPGGSRERVDRVREKRWKNEGEYGSPESERENQRERERKRAREREDKREREKEREVARVKGRE